MDKIIENKKTFNILLIASLIFGALLLLITLLFLKRLLFIIPFYLITVFIGLFAFYYLKIKKPFKENVIPEILKKYKPTIEFIPKLKIKDDYIKLIRKNKLIPSATTFSFEDGIVDKILDLKVTSFDLTASHTQSTGKSTTTVIDFRGRFYDINLKGLPCNFIIKEEILKRIPDGYQFLELEVIEFNKVFNTYVSDKHEAFKVFTPSVIKKYYNLAGIDTDKTIIHYENDHLYVYLYNDENLFENMNDIKNSIIEDYNRQVSNITQYITIFD